jgi:PAS domain S-box-containing protein
VSSAEHPHTALGESIKALGAQVHEVTRRIALLELPRKAKEEEEEEEDLAEAARALDAAASDLSTAHEELEEEMGALRELLEEERIRYRDLFEWAPEAYLVSDPGGRVLAVNSAAEELFGYPRGVLLSGSLTRLLPMTERQAFRSMLGRMPMLEVVADWEVTFMRRDRSTFPASLTVGWIADQGGRVGTLRWLVRDITERKAAERQIVSANIELEQRVRERTKDLVAVGREKEEALARLEAVVDQIPAAIVIADAQSSKVVAANEHAARLVKEVAGDVDTLDTWLTLGFHPGGSPFEIDERPLMRALASGEATNPFDIEFHKLDGSSSLYETSAAPIRNPDGEVVGAVAAYWDLTQRVRLARVEREFVTNAAHELRTPLAALASAIEVLQSGAKEDVDQRERFLAHIEQQSQRLQRLVQSLLLLARVQTLQEEAEREPIPVQSLLANVAALTPEDRIRVESAPADAFVLANRDLVEEALLNLVSNASKYAPEGDIVLSGRTDNGLVVLEVADSGPGMTAEQQERAAERFYRGRDDADGFGLGLSIAQQAAEALDGRLELESGASTGTKARLYLPSARGDD